MLYVFIGILIVMGIVNALLWLCEGKIGPMLLSLICIYPVCWGYSTMYRVVEGVARRNGATAGIVCFLIIGGTWLFISGLYGAAAIERNILKAWMFFNIFLIFGFGFAV